MIDTIYAYGKQNKSDSIFDFSIFNSFQPDYTLAEIAETLTLNTNIGQMTFPIIVRIPQRVLATCYQNIPRPVWEARVYWLCLCAISIILLYILTIAVYEAQRLFNDVIKKNIRSLMTFFALYFSIWQELNYAIVCQQ